MININDFIWEEVNLYSRTNTQSEEPIMTVNGSSCYFNRAATNLIDKVVSSCDRFGVSCTRNSDILLIKPGKSFSLCHASKRADGNSNWQISCKGVVDFFKSTKYKKFEVEVCDNAIVLIPVVSSKVF